MIFRGAPAAVGDGGHAGACNRLLIKCRKSETRMHKIELNASVVETTMARRGKRHVFCDLVPKQTALLVVDLQRAYLDEGLNNSFCCHALDIVPNVNRIANALRRAGGTVAWIQNTATEETLTSWSTYNGRIMSAARRDKRFEGIRDGSPGHALWPGLDVQGADLIIKKTRYSAFIRGSSDLEPQLRRRNIDTLVVTGTGTGTCCESTARDGMMLNFATIMISDGNACASDEEHNAALTAFYRNFGDIMTTDEIIGYIEANAATPATASQR
ncbi:MAG: cysteine hydrolase [Proteobacteria bacterium]|nr:MAG: cysteine hydrolase [Pseudomonadota bacterium]